LERRVSGSLVTRDASSTNVIYDASNNRARLIDFEIYHEKSLAAFAPQADDLLVFLLDLVGPLPTRQWLPFAATFLEAYSRNSESNSISPAAWPGSGGVADQFYESDKSKTATREPEPRNRQIGIL